MDDLTNSILIVDDESRVVDLLANFLGQAGYFCQVANNVEEAKQILAETSFDLLLTDREMPGESGVELIQYTHERYPQTAAVMVTGFDDPELAKEVLEVGVYGYIIKPFTKNLVLITVENALRRHRLELEAQLHTKMLEREVQARTRLLDEQLSFLQTMIDAIPAPIYYKDINRVYLGCNRAFEEILNRNRNAIIGETAEALYPPSLAEAIQRQDQELLQQGSVQIFEKDILHPDGSLHSEITHKATFTDSKGVISGLVGVRLDITELKKTAQSLLASEEKLRSIMDNLHIGVALIGPHMELLQVNRQMDLWFPKAATAIGTDCCFQVFIGQDKQMPCEDCPVAVVFKHGESHESIIKLQTSAGERILRAYASPIFNEAGDITTAIEILEDVTDKLAVERELRQAQKLESIGQLAAGIAHEINTPVQYVGDNIRFLGDAFRDLAAINDKYSDLFRVVKEAVPVTTRMQEVEDAVAQADIPFLLDEIPKTIKQSIDGINRVGAIVRAMREFSHPGTEEKTLVDINRALESTATVSRNEWKYVADLETDLTPDLPLLSCLPGEINQVFLNIIVNAAHAIGDRTEGGSKGKGLIKLSTRIQDAWMEIRITDTGSGIPEPVQHRIFDPFFTTKKIGKGTGQGLAIARSVVVDKHQGTLRFETTMGEGTTFIIQLPLH